MHIVKVNDIAIQDTGVSKFKYTLRNFSMCNKFLSFVFHVHTILIRLVTSYSLSHVI